MLFRSVEGSHETRVFIRCDGGTVYFEGNVSRFGRPDNVSGYSFIGCIQKTNNLIVQYGLPAFTEGNHLRSLTESIIYLILTENLRQAF